MESKLAVWLDRKQASKKMNFPTQTLANWAHNGKGPVYYKIGNRSIRYKESDIDEFMSQFPIEPMY